MKNRICCFWVAVCLLLTAFDSVYAADSAIDVFVDGQKIEFDVPPEIINDSTMVPLRKIFEALSAEISWDDTTQTVTAKKNGVEIQLTVGSPQMTRTENGNATNVFMHPQPMLKDGRTLIPLRAVSQALSAAVVWDEKDSDVYIYNADSYNLKKEMTNKKTDTYLLTNLSEDEYTELSISGSTLTVNFLTQMENLNGVLIAIGDKNSCFDAKTGKVNTVEVPLASVKDKENFALYTMRDGETNYRSYMYIGIVIEKTDNGYVIADSKVYQNNKEKSAGDIDIRKCFFTSVSPEISELSDKICAGITDDYEKLKAISNYVSEYLYYDKDYYQGKTTETTFTPEDVLVSKKSVCSGYARLVRALANAQGIPCISVFGYAAFAPGWTEENVATEETNHEWSVAYANGRWVNIDATWNSENDFIDGAYVTNPMRGALYFDVTDEFLALTHKHIQYAN